MVCVTGSTLKTLTVALVLRVMRGCVSYQGARQTAPLDAPPHPPQLYTLEAAQAHCNSFFLSLERRLQLSHLRPHAESQTVHPIFFFKSESVC